MWIENSNFLIKDNEIPKIPIEFSEESREWWAEQKRRCIEGYSVGGKWMPPNLYFYVNFCTILLNKNENSKTKVPSRPLLRDIEWEVFWAWSAARGLSGFSSIGSMGNSNNEVLDKIRYIGIAPGTPIYNNTAKDLMMLGPRGYGKSYMAGNGIILHEWLFNGAKEYIVGDKLTTNVIVGAGEGKFATETTSKSRISYSYLSKGGIMFNGTYYPHPFFQSSDGTFSGKLEAKYSKKLGGKWQDGGSNSMIKVVSYKDAPLAGTGQRNSVMVKEEIGYFKGLIKSQEADVETMVDGDIKFGSCLYIGTGGDMGGGTLDAYKMFYDPETYDLLQFEDIWESKGKIGMFIPATMKSNTFKDSEGRTNESQALEYLLKERERLRNSKNGIQALSAHMQFNPLVPSEVFLRSSGNIFPTTELKEHLAELETNSIYKDAEMVCELIFNSEGRVEPRIDKSLEPIREFPMSGKSNQDTSGAIVIWHHPELDNNGSVPYGRYYLSLDPYRQEEAGRGASLGSIFVYDSIADTLCAEYTGRPVTLDKFYERCRKLALYYNGQILYENEVTGTKQHFEHKNSLNLLMFQPEYIKDVIPGSKVERSYGIHMVDKLKDHGLLLLRDWLQDEYEPGKMNLRKIRSIPLLQELILFDHDTNVDRVSSMIVMMYAIKENHKQFILEHSTINRFNDPFFSKKLFSKR